jgi:hypothetical protein
MSILRITRNTLCDWINAGLLTALGIGKNNVCDPMEKSEATVYFRHIFA